MSVILVTGANKGIGYEAVKQLSQKKPNDTILLSSRSVKNGEDAIEKMRASESGHQFSNIEVVQLDITDSASIKALVDHIRTKYGKLDVLLHNSGVASGPGEELSPKVLDVNVTAARNTVEALLPLIPKDTGIVTVVASQVAAFYMDKLEPSTRHLLDDAENVDWTKVEHWMEDWTAFSKGEKSEIKWAPVDTMDGQVYFVSKAFAVSWVRAFAVQHPEIKVAIVCPGFCSTDLTGFAPGSRPASAGAESITWPVLNNFKSGQFYQDGKEHPFSLPMPDYFKE